MDINPRFLIDLAIEAGTHIMEVYSQAGEIAFEEKADHSPVTLADQRAHACIASQLQRYYPEIPLLSEEGDLPGWNVRQHWQHCFIIDPLDGTKEFLNRTGEFAVNIAFVVQGQPTRSVVHFPAKNLTYWAARGQGAYCNTQPILARSPKPGGPLKVVVSRSHYNNATRTFVERFPGAEVEYLGATRKAMLVASGEADLYPRFVGSCLWDTAAPQLIVEEAGGRLMVVPDPASPDWLAGEPLRYDVPELENPTFVMIGQGWDGYSQSA
jgi:3'(2'), 5'-bisphosphate nucleotidase